MRQAAGALHVRSGAGAPRWTGVKLGSSDARARRRRLDCAGASMLAQAATIGLREAAVGSAGSSRCARGQTCVPALATALAQVLASGARRPGPAHVAAALVASRLPVGRCACRRPSPRSSLLVAALQRSSPRSPLLVAHVVAALAAALVAARKLKPLRSSPPVAALVTPLSLLVTALPRSPRSPLLAQHQSSASVAAYVNALVASSSLLVTSLPHSCVAARVIDCARRCSPPCSLPVRRVCPH